MKVKNNKQMPKYIKESLKSIMEGEINFVTVKHDDWCLFLESNKKECNCSPKVVVNQESKNWGKSNA